MMSNSPKGLSIVSDEEAHELILDEFKRNLVSLIRMAAHLEQQSACHNLVQALETVDPYLAAEVKIWI